MSRMCVVLLVFSSICTVVVGAPVIVRGFRGERVDIRCTYESGYEKHSKYLCKGECNFGSRNIIVRSGSPTEDPRFSLRDDTTARVFTVTITDLRTEDAGQYWCGVERTLNTDVYSEIMLLVKYGNETTEVSTISPSSAKPSYFSTTETKPQPSSITITDQHKSTDLASVAGGLGSVLLVLVLCSGTFLILKNRKRKSGTALFQQNVPHNTESVHMYNIANRDTGPSDVIAAASSSNQMAASHLKTRSQVSIVYATVTNQQPDSNPRHIHSTNQVMDTDYDYYANINFPEPTTDNRTELIYTTATHPQNITAHPHDVKTNDGSIYSVIKHK
ncbi:CMRF35-like molecule 9 [Carassius gibelio]|uniref:CMRF35-like molecule 9 n=1 Tax=Carassius gibelio TaxID=101364 RepID=UPI00227896ED|nr:CMRF35-like molecule 9 [Carassius gibelio]XP_052474066.1 CMRF35-like molecule 9 [Carassius gibelio]